MTRKDKKSLKSDLIILLVHLLKYKFQSKRITNSWLFTIVEHHKRINKNLKKSPSLKNYLIEIFDQVYKLARQEASTQTKLPVDIFPTQCPFTLENILNPDYLPE